MPASSSSVVSAIPAPSTPLGPFADSAVAWTTWVTLMGFVGLTAVALLAVGPAAIRAGGDVVRTVLTARLARVAAIVGLLAIPAVLTDLSHDAAATGGYDYAAAWSGLYDGSNDGRLGGLEITCSLLGAALIAPLGLRGVAASRARPWLLVGGLGAGAVALGTTKFPDAAPAAGQWGRTAFETVMWMFHLLGGGFWLGGLAGLLIIAWPGGVPAAERGRFWSAAIRRFSLLAMLCVGSIALSGLFLYWEHVDGPSQLLSTMYGRVLGVKILIFGALVVLGAVNQFWLHPRVEALRAAGDGARLHTVLARNFPGVVAVEALLIMAVLFVAPFLHGSARNQAFQAGAAKHVTSVSDLPKLGSKPVSASTWVWGTAETVAVVAVLAGGYAVSARIARARSASRVGSGALVEA